MTDGGDSFQPGEEEAAVPVLRLAPEPPGLEPDPELAPDSGLVPEPALDLEPGPDMVPGTVLATRQQATLAPKPATSRLISPIGVSTREWGRGRKESSPSYVEPETPTDVKIVVGALMVVAIVAAIMVGLLVSNAIAAVIIAVLGLLAIVAFRWLTSL